MLCEESQRLVLVERDPDRSLTDSDIPAHNVTVSSPGAFNNMSRNEAGR
jgi:hypothetical protein